MGGTQSKSSGKDINAANVLDILATKYILTQNFQDMVKLSNPEYCNKLVILTSDIIKKFLKEREIKFLSHRVKDGVERVLSQEAKVIYLSTNKLTKQKKNDIKNDEMERELHPTYNTTGEEIHSNPSVEYLQKNYNADLGNQKTLLSELDVKNKEDKDSMCKGIAKFYIKIAHLFAAIHKAVNPIYKFGTSEYSLMNKLKIPKGAKVSMGERSLCSRRINALKSEKVETSKLKVGIKNCNLNKKTTTKSINSNVLDNINSKFGDSIESGKLLGEEIGIPQLDKLYHDIYNFKKGKFTGMSPQSRKDYEKDLKLFYKTFTGKDDYKKWNKSRQRKFSDIELKAYHKEDACKDVNSDWRKTYVGDEDNILFKKFAENIKNMLKKTNTNQQNLLTILDELFVWIEPPSGIEGGDKSIKSKLVTINPKLNDKKLQDVVVKTRKLIIDIYLQCEKDYQEGLKIFKAIADEKIFKKMMFKTEREQEDMAGMITNNADLEEIVKKNSNTIYKSSNAQMTGNLGLPFISQKKMIMGGKRKNTMRKTSRKTSRKTTRKTTRKNKKSR